MAPEFAAIVLAAGQSSRLGQPKQLLSWQGESLLQRAVRLARTTPAVEVLVVLGSQADVLASQVEATVVQNRRWQEGIGTSLALAASQLDDRLGALVMLCDQPLIDAADLQRLVTTWQRCPADPAAARAADYLGVPALFPSSFLPLLRKLAGNEGARRLLQPSTTSAVEMPHARYDVDTEQDWQSLVTKEYEL